ncbi:MAG: chorismate mutase [Erysipelotrichaceae bacterium]|nr:chorismate mutase [Erysipelotrichaceae bacterium]
MELNELRKQIDKVDKQMAELFEERMNLVKKVGQYKKEHNLPILDKERENLVKEKNHQYIINKDLLPLYDEFISHLMDLSKRNEK